MALAKKNDDSGRGPALPPRNLTVQGATGGSEPRYLSDFRCIGPDCEDTCCAGWAVPVSRTDHRRLGLILGEKERDRVTRCAPRERRPEHDWQPGYATIKTDAQGNCHYLAADRLCRLQLERGEAALTNVCAQYPRYQLQLDAQVERTATLACPEIARRCLLDEQAMDRVAFIPDETLSLWRPKVRVAEESDAYLSQFDPVRGALAEALSDKTSPLGNRLALALVLASQLKPILVKGKPADAGAIERELSTSGSPAFRDELARALVDVPAKGKAPHVLISFILSIYSSSAGTRMAGLLTQVRASYQQDHALQSTTGASLLGPDHFERILAAYTVRRDQVLAVEAARVDTYFTNYALNFLYQLPFFDQTDLVRYVAELLLRIATLRFLFFSHPEVAAALALAPSDSRREALDRVAVATFQSFAREIEHSATFPTRLRGMLAQVGGDGLGDLFCLSRL